MEEMIVKYIAKHGTQGMFDGIEKIVDKPYEWAISKFENYPKMPRNKKGNIANALQAVLASYKVTRRRVDELESEIERLSVGIISTKKYHASETIWKEENIRMQSEITRLRTNNNMLISSVEALSNELEEAKVACQFMINNGSSKEHSSKTPLGVTLCNPIPEMLDLQEDESWERDFESFSTQYSDCTARFPIAPVRTRQNGKGNERVLDQRTENGQAVRQLSFMDFQSLVTAVGTFDPDNMDPVEFLSKLENIVETYSVSDEDACRLLTISIPRSLTSALSQEVRDKRADKGARREALLRLVGTDLVNLRKITEVTMEPGEHPLTFASRLWEMFSCYSGLPNATKQDLMYKSALIAQSSSHMREAIALHVDVNAPYEQIISKMTQYFNANSQRKAAESRQPVAAFGRRECSRLSGRFHQRPRRFDRVNSEGVTLCYACGKAGHIARHCQDRERPHQKFVCHACGKYGHIARHCLEKGQKVVCFACGRMGHQARQCHFSHKRKMGYHDLLKKIGNLETQLALLKGNKEEAIHTLPDTALHEHDCCPVTSRC